MRRLSLKFLRVTLFSAVFASAMVVTALAADLKVGTVNADVLHLRETASTSAKSLAKAENGNKVVILDTKDGWYKVVFASVQGYMHSDYIKASASADFAIGTGLVNGTSVNMRKKPSTDSGVIMKLDKNVKVSVVGIESGWYKVTYKDKTGYVHPDYLEVTKSQPVSRGKEEPAPPAEDKDSAKPADEKDDAQAEKEPSQEDEQEDTSEIDAVRAEIIAYAKTFLGCSYRYGSMNGKTFDCSGFTTYVFKKFGYSLNRSAAGQLSNGTKVTKSELKQGDLVFFRDPSINKAAASHVGIYIADGKFIHCSSRGGGVKYNNLSGDKP